MSQFREPVGKHSPSDEHVGIGTLITAGNEVDPHIIVPGCSGTVTVLNLVTLKSPNTSVKVEDENYLTKAEFGRLCSYIRSDFTTSDFEFTTVKIADIVRRQNVADSY